MATITRRGNLYIHFDFYAKCMRLFTMKQFHNEHFKLSAKCILNGKANNKNNTILIMYINSETRCQFG